MRVCRHAVIATLVLAAAGCVAIDRSPVGGTRHPWTIPHVLRIAESEEPSSLNPYRSNLDVVHDLTSLLYSYLVTADDKGHLIGDLALVVPTLGNGGISPDGRTYTYRLRRNARWHDGVPFTARDVVASLHALLDPARPTGIDETALRNIASVATPDSHTLVVRLKEPYSPFVTRFFTPLDDSGRPVLPAHVLDGPRDGGGHSLGEYPVGTGPFRFVAWRRGEDIELARYKGYFRGVPRLQRIVIDTIPDGQTALTQLQTHQVDLLATPEAPLVDLYRRIRGVIVALVPANWQAVLMINSRRPGLRDTAVRRALALAIPYRQILSSVTHGLYEPGRSTLLPSAIGYVREPQRRYDVAAAVRMLRKDGWKKTTDGIRSRGGVRLAFTLATFSGVSTAEQIGLLMQSSLRLAGIALAIKPFAIPVLYAPNGLIHRGDYDVTFGRNVLGTDPDVYETLGCDQWYPRGRNDLGFCDPHLDALERRGLHTQSPEARANIYRAASDLIWSDVPYIILYQARTVVVRSVDLHNYQPNATNSPWWNAWQWDI